MIESGESVANAGSSDWTLHQGTGLRSYQSPDIKFNLPFPGVPSVMVALTSLDADHSANLRLNVEAADSNDRRCGGHCVLEG